jgi:hypothetical protein
MNGIYLTQEGKQEIEAKIAQLEQWSKHNEKVGEFDSEGMLASELKEILSSAIILPVEESWYKVIENVENDSQSLILQTPFIMKSLYEQGIIIQPKQ